jgi:hypothetical protein
LAITWGVRDYICSYLVLLEPESALDHGLGEGDSAEDGWSQNGKPEERLPLTTLKRRLESHVSVVIIVTRGKLAAKSGLEAASGAGQHWEGRDERLEAEE